LFFNVHVVETDQESSQCWRQVLPARSPVDIWSKAQHKLDVFTQSISTVDKAERNEFNQPEVKKNESYSIVVN